MRTFKLVRREDFSGVSGTGEVAEGVEFSDGTCAMRWATETSSTAFYNSAQELVNIHGHEGRTVVQFDDGTIVSDVKDSDKEKGLYEKYLVYKRKKDSHHYVVDLVEDWVFVLNPTTDLIAVEALYHYADVAHQLGYIKLAEDIYEKLEN